MPRKAREISPFQIYHVVIKGADRQVMFEEIRDYQKYIDILDYYREKCDFNLYAYCLMSNHVHLIIHTNTISLSSIFRRINTTYAGWFNSKYNRTGFLQDGRFFSEPIDSAAYLFSAIRYIHYNPTKAGLEKSPGQNYPWNSYTQFLHPTSALVDSQFILSHFGGIKNFIDFHKEYPTENIPDIEKIRSHLPDDVAKDIILDISQCKCSTDFQNLSLKNRNHYIRQIHEKGVSIRQLNRLTGTPKGIIERILKNQL